MTIFFLFVTFHVCLCHSVTKREESINKPIDALIKDFNELVTAGKVESVSIGDFTSTFEKKVRFIKLKGAFSASNGHVKDLSTIRRTGDATVSATPTTMTVTLHLGLEHLQVVYDNYKATFEVISVEGDVTLDVATNSVFLQMTFVFQDEDTCTTELNQAYIEALDGVSVTVSNLGALRWIYEKVVEWVLDKFRDEVTQKIQTSLTNALLKNRTINSLCDLARYI